MPLDGTVNPVGARGGVQRRGALALAEGVVPLCSGVAVARNVVEGCKNGPSSNAVRACGGMRSCEYNRLAARPGRRHWRPNWAGNLRREGGRAAAIDVGVRTGSFGLAMIAGLTTLGVGFAMSAGVQAGLGVVADVFGPAAKEAIQIVLAVTSIPMGAYGAAQAADNGMVASAAVAAAVAALGAYALFRAWRTPANGVRSESQRETQRGARGVQVAQKTDTANDAIEVTYEDRLAAKAIMGEAANKSEGEKQCIACVIRNRVKSPNFPNSVEKVVTPDQFQGLTNDQARRLFKGGEFISKNPAD